MTFIRQKCLDLSLNSGINSTLNSIESHLKVILK